ncbi:MAG: type II toxin-antitoxin system VapC family toxin [Gemmatimonadales bacterium]|jgi:predicted nucleic acid-binding protein|nr:type II toxin-antitoxin system VapC family toxin [Gemmatimonadales bacterium]
MTFNFESVPVVVDASAAIELLGGDAGWTEMFDRWVTEDRMLLAPAHFLAEVANGQLIGQRVPAADVASRLERLLAAGMQLADRGLPGLLEAITLADRHRLTVYDALYLQLALDVDGQLATLDRDLARAATAEDVTLAA